MRYERFLDWIGATLFPINRDKFVSEQEPETVLPEANFVYIGRATNGYANLLQDTKTGAIAKTGATDGKRLVLLQCSGNSLREIRKQFNYSDNHLMARIAHANGRTSRIDCAVDLHGCAVTPDKFYKALKSNRAKTTARKPTLLDSSTDNTNEITCEVGNRQSERFLRCYDKNGESGIDKSSEAWIRFELELKGVRAHMFGKSAEQNTVDSLIVGHMRDFVQWPNSDLETALSGDYVDPEQLPRKSTNTEKWLIDTVAPSLAKAIFLNEDFSSEFYDRMLYFLEQHKASQNGRNCVK